MNAENPERREGIYRAMREALGPVTSDWLAEPDWPEDSPICQWCTKDFHSVAERTRHLQSCKRLKPKGPQGRPPVGKVG